MKQQSKSDFLLWYDLFIKNFGGVKYPESFFDRVEKAHESIRNHLGSAAIDLPIEVGASLLPTSPAVTKHITQEIFSRFNEYFNYHRFKETILLEPTLVDPVTGKLIRTNKHILFWADKHCSEEEVSWLNVALTKLGKLKSENSSKSLSVNVRIGTEARDFAMLGRYDIDSNSCFRQGGENEKHKYILGMYPNSYIILVYLQDHHVKPTILSRLLGVATEDLKTWSYFNIYPNKWSFADVGTITNAVNKFLYKISRVDDPTTVTNGALTIPFIYQNKQINYWVTHSLNQETKLRFEYSYQKQHSDTLIACAVCKNIIFRDETRVVDGLSCCEKCATGAQKCEYTGDLTKQLLVEACFDNKKLMVKKSLVDEMVFIRCSKCGKIKYNSEVRAINGYYICDTCNTIPTETVQNASTQSYPEF